MNILIAVLIFSILVLFHEFGHFLFARLCGVTVVEFSLGMGPRLISHVSKKSRIRYSLKALPFGGSCQMQGEDEADEAEGSFGRAKVWQRFLIVAAGPVFNFLLAFVFSVFLIAGAGYDPPVVLDLTEDFPAERAGIKPGDTITRLGNSPVFLYRDITAFTLFHHDRMVSGEKLKISWKHEGRKHSAYIVPEKDESGRYLIGISGTSMYRLPGGPLSTVKYAVIETGYWVRTTVESLAMVLKGGVTLDDVSGPVGIVKTIGDTYEESKNDGAYYVWLNMLQISILLSANLGVMNLLPVPALDGGRLLFLLLEGIRRRKIDPKVEAAVNYAGFMLLMGLIAVIMVHDTGKLIG